MKYIYGGYLIKNLADGYKKEAERTGVYIYRYINGIIMARDVRKTEAGNKSRKAPTIIYAPGIFKSHRNNLPRAVVCVRPTTTTTATVHTQQAVHYE